MAALSQQPQLTTHPSNHPWPLQVVGKLRVRLSCLRPNEQLASELPLVSERSRGARLAGTVRLTLQVSYDSPVRPWEWVDGVAGAACLSTKLGFERRAGPQAPERWLACARCQPACCP